MSRTVQRIAGSGALGAWASGDRFTLTAHAEPLRNNFDLLLLGQFRDGLLLGGSDVVGQDASASGDVDLPGIWMPVRVDNTGSQLSGFTDANGATLVVQMRFYVRVSNAGITVTPKVVYGTDGIAFGSTATISGEAACSATSADYSGTDQVQTVAVTLPSGVKYFKPKLTIGGTPAAGYQVWGKCLFDLYVSS